MKMLIITCITALSIFYSLGSCAQENENQDLDNPYRSYCSVEGFISNDKSISFCGRIDPGHDDDLANIIKSSNPKEIVINSQGGDTGAAMNIARLIAQNDIEVVIEGRCFSACAHFILMTAPQVTVEENSVVGFHYNAAASTALLGRSDLLPKEGVEFHLKLAAREVLFYREFGLSIEWLLEPLWRVKPICFDRFHYAQNGQIVGARLKLLYRSWTPRKSFVEKIRNSQIQGYWPESESEFKRAVAHAVPEQYHSLYSFQASLDDVFWPKSGDILSKCEDEIELSETE